MEKSMVLVVHTNTYRFLKGLQSVYNIVLCAVYNNIIMMIKQRDEKN